MKTALITGFSRGIGKAITEKFLNEGWHVIGVCRNIDDTFTHENLEPIAFDLSKVEAIPNLVSQIESVDVLVNNAGIIGGDRDDEIAVNLVSPVELTLQLSEKMKNLGRVINIASIAGYTDHTGNPDIWYSITKAGLINATNALAKKLAGKVLVNAIAPGPVGTEMFSRISEERKETLLSKTIHKRPAEPEEIANTVFWLAEQSPEYINGTCIDVNDGAR